MLLLQSAIEEALERIKAQKGVEGYVICNLDYVVLRRAKTLTKQEVDTLALKMTQLSETAKDVARDLDPKDDLKLIRIKTGRKEVIVSREEDFIVIVLQEWKH